ncbi:hypothetical protein GCM10007939_08130 [Amylibacter marinus]|uniref:RNA-binding S4 domain-containing protein n=1 Tax=Amylibacter marinus TaxID=1475483 RepID=A0ABQ5VT61_9RHOB|nr:hypothetical protein GCM10007939_08130 [Amylibacter marinus]
MSAGKIRVNDTRISKPSVQIKIGDELKFETGDWARIIHICAIGSRRGPAPEAQALYEDRSEPPPERNKYLKNPRFEGKGRPSRKERQAMSSFSTRGLD